MSPTFIAHTRLFKYAIKRRVIGVWPDAWWIPRRLLRGLPEAEMALLPLLCKRDAAFVDVGAAFGYYTWFASRYAGSVHAFEPLPELAAMLGVGFKGAAVQVHACALSNREGTAELRVPRANIGFSTVERSNDLAGKADTSAGVARLSVATRRLDDVVNEPVSCLKIDVEGHELEVLHGADRTLRRWHPAIIVEVEERHRVGSVAAVGEHLDQRGYERWVMRDGALRRHPLTDALTGARNFVFLQPGTQLYGL